MTLFGKKAQILDLFAQVETVLYENERLIYPTCFLRQDLFVGAELQSLHARLIDIVKKHKGKVTQNMDEADHVIYPPSVDEVSDASKCQWIRVLRKGARKDSILIHRLFTPDSHDEWLNNIDVDDDVAGLNDSDNNASNSEVWEVTANWLLDTDLYNEWMNQEDYEVDADQTNSDGRGGVKLKKPPKLRKTLDDIVKRSNKSSSKRSPSPTPPLNKKAKVKNHKKKLP